MKRRACPAGTPSACRRRAARPRLGRSIPISAASPRARKASCTAGGCTAGSPSAGYPARRQSRSCSHASAGGGPSCARNSASYRHALRPSTSARRPSAPGRARERSRERGRHGLEADAEVELGDPEAEPGSGFLRDGVADRALAGLRVESCRRLLHRGLSRLDAHPQPVGRVRELAGGSALVGLGSGPQPARGMVHTAASATAAAMSLVLITDAVPRGRTDRQAPRTGVRGLRAQLGGPDPDHERSPSRSSGEKPLNTVSPAKRLACLRDAQRDHPRGGDVQLGVDGAGAVQDATHRRRLQSRSRTRPRSRRSASGRAARRDRPAGDAPARRGRPTAAMPPGRCAARGRRSGRDPARPGRTAAARRPGRTSRRRAGPRAPRRGRRRACVAGRASRRRARHGRRASG